MNDEASAAPWIQDQQQGWETGNRFGFAIVESQTAGIEGQLTGKVILKKVTPGASSAEVG